MKMIDPMKCMICGKRDFAHSSENAMLEPKNVEDKCYCINICPKCRNKTRDLE